MDDIVRQQPSSSQVNTQWISEVRHYLPTTPIILVGLKKEYRNDAQTIAYLRRDGQQPVQYEQVITIAASLLPGSPDNG